MVEVTVPVFARVNGKEFEVGTLTVPFNVVLVDE